MFSYHKESSDQTLPFSLLPQIWSHLPGIFRMVPNWKLSPPKHSNSCSYRLLFVTSLDFCMLQERACNCCGLGTFIVPEYSQFYWKRTFYTIHFEKRTSHYLKVRDSTYLAGFSFSSGTYVSFSITMYLPGAQTFSLPCFVPGT